MLLVRREEETQRKTIDARMGRIWRRMESTGKGGEIQKKERGKRKRERPRLSRERAGFQWI